MPQSESSFERRQHPRYEVESAGTAFVLCNSQAKAIPVTTRNISEGGVLIVAEDALQGDRMLIKLELERFEGVLIECEVAHRKECQRELINGKMATQTVCGLKFVRFLQELDVHETLLGAFPRGAKANDKRQRRRKSLVPFLSAIALAIVYAADWL